MNKKILAVLLSLSIFVSGKTLAVRNSEPSHGGLKSESVHKLWGKSVMLFLGCVIPFPFIFTLATSVDNKNKDIQTKLDKIVKQQKKRIKQLEEENEKNMKEYIICRTTIKPAVIQDYKYNCDWQAIKKEIIHTVGPKYGEDFLMFL